MLAPAPANPAAKALHLAMQDLQRTILRADEVIRGCQEVLARTAALSGVQDLAGSPSSTKEVPFASGPNQVTIASTTATTPQTSASASP